MLNTSGDFAAGFVNVVAAAIKQTSSEKFSHDNAVELLAKRNELFSRVINPENLENTISEVCSAVVKNITNICAIANYSFAEYLFWLECEGADLKKYRTGTGTEDSSVRLARTIRRRAEECYKAGNFNEAVKIFKEADEKYPGDFTVHYQLGLIYFFEKSDYHIAVEYFRKASKYSQNKSKQVFINSMVFTGLLLRLFAYASSDANMFSEAYQAVMQAYNSDPSYIFSIYALVQANTFNSASKKEALSLIKDLIKREKYFTIQIIYDRAFDPVIDGVEALYDSLIGDALNSAAQTFAKIDERLEELSKSVKFLTIPAKLAAMKKDYEEIRKLTERKNCFEVIMASEKASSILNSLIDFLEEVKKNKAYFEVRDLIETLSKSFNEEYKESVKSHAKKEEKLTEIKAALTNINKNYPIAEAERTVKKKNSDAEEIIPATADWRKGKLFLFVRFISGCLAFTIVCAAIFIAYLFMREHFEQHMWMLVSLVVLNLFFLPVYGSILAEIYYIIIENKRKNLQNATTRLEKEIDLNKTRVSDIEKGLREKYYKIVSEKTKVSKFTASQMLDAGIEGSFEKIKTLMP
jgi:tetratricopeptide (TPR) repeat protein